jgi:activator of HSP90 ATPase
VPTLVPKLESNVRRALVANDFVLSDVIPVAPQAVYDAWMSSAGHTAMTGSPATVDPRVGGAFEAWDGYITGRTISLEPGHRIVQSWRTSEFSDDEGDSQIEVVLDPDERGTSITIRHTKVPDGHFSYDRDEWTERYFEPMRRYFSSSEGH